MPQAAHHSHAAAVSAVQAAFDGRTPTPADLVDWQRGNELLAEALGLEQEAGGAASANQPAIRAMHQDQVGFGGCAPISEVSRMRLAAEVKQLACTAFACLC